jgi:hypothetical protein
MVEDQTPELEAMDDDQFVPRLERMKQRFALASVFFAKRGETAWKGKKGWINATLHECQWFGCCCGACFGPYAYYLDGVYCMNGLDNGRFKPVACRSVIWSDSCREKFDFERHVPLLIFILKKCSDELAAD